MALARARSPRFWPAFTPDEGRILLVGDEVHFTSPMQALAAGVAIVHQELSFCENMTVAENLCLGRFPGRAGFLAATKMRERARELLSAIGAHLDVDTTAGELTIGEQQMVQIASAIGRGARIVIFDEPTSSLSEHEALRLYDLLGRLKTRGVTSIYVSHRLEEIFRLCDAVTVLRDGRHVATTPMSALDQSALVEMMIGRRLDEYFPSHVEHRPSGTDLRRDRRTGDSATCRSPCGLGRRPVCRTGWLRPVGGGACPVRHRSLDRRHDLGARSEGCAKNGRRGDRAWDRPRP
jgi:ABC-type sugar transport system ATPase subunit